ncbi:MAG: carbohydrate kinase, partial [Acidobacteriota bacterium]
MKASRLREVLDRLPDLRILVLGDFFLDQYWSVDPRLAEDSVETGLEAHQVTEVRQSPGAAGTVANNLVALGVGSVEALSVIGDDGNGYALRKALTYRGVHIDRLISAPGRFTPTYTKPMRQNSVNSETEMNRFDIKNRSRTPRALQEEVIRSLEQRSLEVDGIAIMDQVEEEGCGTVTAAVRDALMKRGTQSRPVILADSRRFIGFYRSVLVKPNLSEAGEALGGGSDSPADLARKMAARTGRPVFLTLGGRGIGVFDGVEYSEIPALRLTGPLDIVGAGDSTNAA